MIVVPTDTPGFSVARKLEKIGNYCSDTAELVYEDARVPVGNRIGEEGMGFIYQMRQFQKERIVAAIGAAAAAQKMLERTVQYVKDRMVFGAPLARKQHVQFTLAELRTEIEMLRQLNYHCVRMIVAGEDGTLETSMAKLAASEAAHKAADKAMQILASAGYRRGSVVERLFRDVRATEIYQGTSEAQRMIIAERELGI